MAAADTGMLLGRIGSGGASRPKNSTSAWPLAEEYPVSSRALKVRILSGSLADSVKGPCTGTVSHALSDVLFATHTYLHTYTCTDVHTYVQTDIYTCVQTDRQIDR